jgi:hypothetical protein
MLSIGKVGGGQASPSYYVEHVAQGAEDYYAGAGEARGQWHGRGAAARGLSGTVGDDEFLGLLSADDGPGKTVLGYDLTFSAPKSVSLLFGLGDPELSDRVRAAHDEAVRQALDYVERHACWTRRGAQGRSRLRGDGLTVAPFGTAPRAPATPNSTPTPSSPTPRAPTTGPPPWTAKRSTRTPARPATSTRPPCATR